MRTTNRLGLVVAAVAALSPFGLSCGGDGGDESGVQLFEARKKPRPTHAPPLPPPEPEPEPVPTPDPAGPATFASRTTGVAPLAVFFDAVNTTSPAYDSGVVQPGNNDYGAFQYTWDFGDPDSGTWSTNGRSKNADTGYAASHVYESPGSYTITLTVVDSLGDTHVYSQGITVSVFSGTTYYISNSGNDANSGLSPSTAWRTFAKMASQEAPNRRFLFNRGETFTATSSGSISSSGPGIIGAYGSGARPIIQSTGSGNALILSGSDWRVMDLEFVGPGLPSNFGMSIRGDVYSERMLMLRLKSSNFFGPLGWADQPSMFATPHTEITVSECELTSGAYWCAFVGGRRLAITGNVMDGVTVDGHVLRIWQADKGVVAHNNLSNGIHHALKLHGTIEGSGQAPTRFIQVSDNLLSGGVQTVTIGPENSTEDERVVQAVFERNWFEANGDTQRFFMIWARDVTVRNNVFAGNGCPGVYAIRVEPNGSVVPPPARVRILNNTFYKGDSGSDFAAVHLSSGASDVTIRNNLASAPAIGNAAFLIGSCPGLVAQSNLLSNSPGFTNAGALNFTLTTLSAARNVGLTLGEVRHDYTRTTTRPQGAAYDLGAYERN